MTVEQMEVLAAQLPPQEQLKLVARISERLSAMLPVATDQERAAGRTTSERLRLAEELLAEAEDIEDDAQGQLDAAETIQGIRNERTGQICRRGV